MMPQPLSSTQRIILLLGGLLSLVALLAAGYLASQNQYTVYDGLDLHTVSGTYETVADVLTAADISVAADDIVYPSLTTAADPATAIQVQRARQVTVRTEDGRQVVRSHQPNLAAFLNEANIIVRRTDQLVADGRPVLFSDLEQTRLPRELEIGRFLTVTIRDGEQQQTVRTAAQTVGELLREANRDIYAADGVTPELGSWLSPNMEIVIFRSQPVTIHVDGRVIQTRSHHRNALDVVAEAGIGLVGHDYTIPGPEVSLRSDDSIQIVRVTEDFRIEDEPIPFETLLQGTDKLEIDSRALLSQGSPGVLRRRVRVRYENGIEVSQAVDGEWVAREPINQVMGYGTRIEVRILDTPDGPVEYWRQVRMRVTAYSAATSGKAPDHPAYGITRSGLPAGYGIVAVDPAVIPFRSQVYVPGYGQGFAGDTGGGVKGRWIDLGYPDGELVHWSGYVDVYYLTPVPSPGNINYLLPTWLP